MKYRIFLFFLILFLPQCGFSPIYINENKTNFEIIVDDASGNQFINNLIFNEIKKISTENSPNKINLKINSYFEKNVLSKDSRGSPTEFELSTVVSFIIENSNEKQKFSYNEKQNITKMNNLYEQKNYEDTVKQNFASSIVRKLNYELIYKK